MADGNVFPLVLAIREDGSVESTMAGFEQSILASTTRAAGGFATIRRQVDELRQSAAQKISDPLGIQASMRSLSTSPIQKAIDGQISASNALAEQQRRASAARVQQIGREFDTAMQAIRGEQAARTAANAEVLSQYRAVNATTIALAQQQAAEMARLVSAPRQVSFGLDVTDIQAAATEARVQAARLEEVALAAERSSARVAQATLTDRAYADGARAAAAAAGEEATRLTDLAATQARVAAQRAAPQVDSRSALDRLLQGSAAIDRAALSGVTLEQVLGRVADRSAGLARNVELTREAEERATAAAQAHAEAIGRQVSEAARLVAAPSQQPSGLYYNPQGSQQAAAAARAQASALALVAREAENVAAATGAATAADRAFATTARLAATAAAEEAGRLEEVAATQGRVAAAITAGGGKAVQGTELLTNSLRGQRFATIQASQQFQDFFIQIQGGTSPLIALSQQGSQLAYVLASSGGEAGKFARFMAGGWGTLIFAGISVLSLLIGYLGTHAKAQDESAAAADRMAKHQQALARFVEQTTGRILEQNQALVQNQAIAEQKNANDLAKKYKASRNELLRERLPTVTNVITAGSLGNEVETPQDASIVAALERYKVGGHGAAAQLAVDLQTIGRAAPGLKQTTDRLIGMTAAVVTNAREATTAAAARKVLLGDNSDATRRIAFGDFSPATTDTAKLRADAAAAAIDEGTSALRAAGTRRKAALAQLDKDFNVKGGVIPEAQSAAYQGRATAIEAQFNREKKAADAVNEARSDAASTARRVAGEHRQELFADAKAIGDGTATVQAANSLYEAQIARLRNQLREGIITDEQAHAAAVNARQIRDAAVVAAEGAKKLDESLQRIGQDYTGDASFVTRINKARRDVAAALAKVDPVTDEATINGRMYNRSDLLADNQNLDTAYNKPITDATRQLREQAQVQAQILAGHEDEADFLRLKNQLLGQYGDLLPEERAKLEGLLEPLRDQIVAEKDRNAEIERRSLMINAEVAAARRVQDAYTNFLQAPFAKGSLSGLGDALTKSRQQQIAEKLSIQLFGGDLGSRVHDALTRGSAPLQAAADHHVAAAEALTKAAGALTASATAANDNAPTLAERTTTPSAYGLSGLYGGPATTDPATGDIVVTGSRTARAPLDDALGSRLSFVGTGLTDLSGALDTSNDDAKRRASREQAATVALSYAAQAIGGKGGAAVNALLNANATNTLGKDIAKQLGGSLGKTVGGAIQGLGIGQAVGSGLALLGLKGGGTGSAVGGAIGGAAFGPLGAIGGSVIGGLISSLFYKAPKGQAGISVGSDGTISAGTATGTSKAAIAQAGTLAGAVSSGLQSIADQLGGIIGGSTDVQIGTYKDMIRVNDHGGAIGGVKGSGAITFDTEQAAISYAIQDAIKDGVITGLSAGTQQLIRVGANLDRQIQKALSFEGVFTQLRALKDPIGAATEALEKELTNMRAIFVEAGATTEQNAQLEELYALKRADAVEQAQQQVTGQLQDLLDSINYKGDSGLSLRTRETNANAALAPLIAQITAGKTVDQGQYTAAAQAYLDIERQLYGSTSKYFDALSNITGLTQRAITNTGATNVTSIADVSAKAAQAAADAAVASQTSFTIPEDRVAMMTGAQFSDAVAAGMADQTATLVQAFATTSAAQVKAISAALADDGNATGLPMIMALRNA